MISKIIHQTWKSYLLPKNMDFCVNSWKIKNLDYKYYLWSDEDIFNFVTEYYPQYLNLLNNAKLGIQKADIFRILALYHYGGIYVDIDFECLLPIDLWKLKYDKIN